MGSPGCLRETLGGVGGFGRLETGGNRAREGQRTSQTTPAKTTSRPRRCPGNRTEVHGCWATTSPHTHTQSPRARVPRWVKMGIRGAPPVAPGAPKGCEGQLGLERRQRGRARGLDRPGASQPRQEQEAAAARDLGPRQQLCARGRGGDAAALPAQRSALSASSSPSDAAGARMVLPGASAGLRSLLRRRLPHLSAPRSAAGCRRRPGSARARPALGPSCAAPAGAAAPAPQRASHPAAASASASCRSPL